MLLGRLLTLQEDDVFVSTRAVPAASPCPAHVWKRPTQWRKVTASVPVQNYIRIIKQEKLCKTLKENVLCFCMQSVIGLLGFWEKKNSFVNSVFIEHKSIHIWKIWYTFTLAFHESCDKCTSLSDRKIFILKSQCNTLLEKLNFLDHFLAIIFCPF